MLSPLFGSLILSHTIEFSSLARLTCQLERHVALNHAKQQPPTGLHQYNGLRRAAHWTSISDGGGRPLVIFFFVFKLTFGEADKASCQ